MITILSLNPSTDQDELFDSLVAQFEEIDEALDEKLDQEGTEEEIDAHELLSGYTNDYHDGDGNWGRLTDATHIFIQSGNFITLVIEQDPADSHTILKAWYTDSWEDLDTFAQQF